MEGNYFDGLKTFIYDWLFLLNLRFLASLNFVSFCDRSLF